jgi:hypothetical protein
MALCPLCPSWFFFFSHLLGRNVTYFENLINRLKNKEEKIGILGN